MGRMAKAGALVGACALATALLGGCVVADNDPVDLGKAKNSLKSALEGLEQESDSVAEGFENMGEDLAAIPNDMADDALDKAARIEISRADGPASTLEGAEVAAFVRQLGIGSWTPADDGALAKAQPAATAAIWQNETVKLGQDPADVNQQQVATMSCYPDLGIIAIELTVAQDGGIWLFGDLGVDLSREAQRLLTFHVPDSALRVFETA